MLRSNTTLEALEVSGMSKIGDEGATAILMALKDKNTTLTSLFLPPVASMPVSLRQQIYGVVNANRTGARANLVCE